MEILVVDDSRKRQGILCGMLEKKGTSISCCSSSNDFISVVDESAPDRIVLDLDTWRKGKGIYNYFGFAGRLSGIPIVFFNAPENFSTLQGREPHEQDRILRHPTEVKDLVSVIE
ncbi:MAG: response regulator [Chitinivibrionales bacterium]|nr:response regulator [Chitinivibrionales bacterium]